MNTKLTEKEYECLEELRKKLGYETHQQVIRFLIHKECLGECLTNKDFKERIRAFEGLIEGILEKFVKISDKTQKELVEEVSEMVEINKYVVYLNLALIVGVSFIGMVWVIYRIFSHFVHH